ncbi:EamA domain-containing membrane protein RarD [Marinobacterium stanieri]|uniref:EamA domain-containing membrane protein RarD n=2 Tax=Marinobacterium stanieri TaxID=49186 RepID=A0A1N6UP12_9GAMM|nr:EamA domain-containing membrane protein RarD [Marinobacterium stanieri]
MLQRLLHHTHTLSPTEKSMGIITLAMFLIPGLDAIAKLLTADLSPIQIGCVRFGLQALLLGTLLIRSDKILPARHVLLRLMMAGFWIAGSAGFLFWGLSYLPLANNTAIFFVEPLILMLISAALLGESIQRYQYLAVIVGLLGAMVVIRPNWEAYGAAALLPLLAATCFASHVATLRHLSSHIGSLASQFWISLFACMWMALAVLSGELFEIEFLQWRAMNMEQSSLLLLMAVVATLAFGLVSIALKRAPASLLAPFQYLEIISATALGYLIFGDYPDGLTWLGTFIILGSGLYLFYRERRTQQLLR